MVTILTVRGRGRNNYRYILMFNLCSVFGGVRGSMISLCILYMYLQDPSDQCSCCVELPTVSTSMCWVSRLLHIIFMTYYIIIPISNCWCFRTRGVFVNVSVYMELALLFRLVNGSAYFYSSSTFILVHMYLMRCLVHK